MITPANLATNMGVWQTAGTNISYGSGNVAVSGGAFAGSGAGLSNLNASALSAGTIPDARQSTNVALLNGSQTFSGNPTFSGSVTLNGTPVFYNGLTVWGGSINPNSSGAVTVNGSVYSGGTYSGFYAYERGSTSTFWTFYSVHNRATFYRANVGDMAAIDASGNVYASGSFFANSSPDLAETIPAAPDVEAGDIVCADPNKAESVMRCGKSSHGILGVISDGTGGFLINSHAKTTDSPLTGAPLVLVGRVPVKVSLEGGAVKIGDYLAPSSVPGVAMRSAESDGTIGLALAAFDGADAANGVGKVLCFVKVTQRDSEIESLKETIAELKADIQALRQSSGRLQDNSRK